MEPLVLCLAVLSRFDEDSPPVQHARDSPRLVLMCVRPDNGGSPRTERLKMRVQEWSAVLGMAGVLVSACSPDEVQAPGDGGAVRPKIEAAAAPTSGLVGEWKLDEASGATAVDTKNGYNATVFGGAAFVAGKLGNALNLNNGTSGTGAKWAEMPSNPTLDVVQEGNYTISAWFYPYSVPTFTTPENRYWAIVNKQGQH